MRKLLLYALLSSAPLFADGSVRQSLTQLGTTNTWVLSYNWTGDANTGTVPITPAALNSCGCQGYLFTQVEVVPQSPSPTAGYSVAILDSGGADILDGAAASLSSSSTQSFAAAASATPLQGTFRLSISGQSVASAKGTVFVFLSKPGTVNLATLGRGGGATSTANWLTIANPPFTDPRRYNWTPQTSGGLLGVGSNTIALVVPAGITADCINTCLIRLSGGIGTGESVPITAVGLSSVTVVCLHTHVGYTVGPNSSGIQEAIIAAGVDGAVRMFSGISTLWGNVAPSVAYPNGIAAVTIPAGYNTSVHGYGRYATTIYTVGTTGDWIRFECAAPCTSGSGGIGELVGFAMLDSGGTPHTSGAMIRLRYTADFHLDDIFVNEAYDGIVNEGGIRFDHHAFTIGTSHNGYYVTCKDPGGAQVNYPTCISYGTAADFQISSATSGTHAIHIEAPTAGVLISSPYTGAADNTSNVSLYIAAVGTNPWNEIEVGGKCILDGHQVGIQILGNTSSYTDNTINVENCRVNAAQYGAYIGQYVQSVSLTNNFLGAAVNGAGSDVGVFLSDHVQQARFVNNRILTDGPCFNSAGVASFGSVQIEENNCGLAGTSPSPPVPTAGIGFSGTFAGLTVRNNDLSAATTPIAGTFTATSFTAVNNTGVDNVIPSVASGSSVAFPVNPTFTLTGSTGVSAVTVPLIAGSKYTFIATDVAPGAWTAGATIGNTFTPTQNVPVACSWDGTRIWCKP